MCPESFGVRSRRLAEERGWSVERLIHAAWDPETRGTSPGMIRKALNGQRTVTVPLIRAIANALGVPPDAFVEYRLACVRRLFDETSIGLETAAENYAVMASAFPELTKREDRLGEPADHQVADVVGRLRAARETQAAAAGRPGTQAEAAAPPQHTASREALRRARQPR